MKNKFEEFLNLHKEENPLLLGNVWNAQSASVFEQKKFKALATSSAAVAETLGYADGQVMPLEEYFFVVRRIMASVSIPFSVDLEGGYGETPEQISGNVIQLYNMGVSGINIEDSIVANGNRSILEATTFAKKLVDIMKLLEAGGTKMFINVRSDSFLMGLPNALEDALSRVDAYQNTGVHGLFFPCVKHVADIEKITKRSKLPINVMCIPDLPDFATLKKAGVKRVSFGSSLNSAIYKQLETSVDQVVNGGSFKSLFRA